MHCVLTLGLQIVPATAPLICSLFLLGPLELHSLGLFLIPPPSQHFLYPTESWRYLKMWSLSVPRQFEGYSHQAIDLGHANQRSTAAIAAISGNSKCPNLTGES